MGAPINLTDEQREAIETLYEEGYTKEKGFSLIEEYGLPFDDHMKLYEWMKYNLKDKGSSHQSKSASPSLRNINKFGENTEAMRIADLLTADPEKALSGAISALEEDIELLDTATNQEIAKLQAARDEKCKLMKEKIAQLQALLPKR